MIPAASILDSFSRQFHTANTVFMDGQKAGLAEPVFRTRIRTQRCNQLRPRMCVLFESGGLSYPDPGGPGDGSPAGSGWRVLDLVRLGGAAGSDGLKAETKLEGKVGPVIGCFNGRNISNR